MKAIGLIGGMSWRSSAHYYRLINEGVHERLGGHRNAPSVMVTVDFHEVEAAQRARDWTVLARMMADAAARLERAGAGCVVLCTNTMHKVAYAIEEAVAIPLLHIADATATAMRADARKRVALLGTRFTMEEPFYRERLERTHGLEVLVPDDADRAEVDRIIFDELVHGRVHDASRAAYDRAIARLAGRGAEAVILGCTEIGLLYPDGTAPLPAYDTTRLHAAAAVAWMCETGHR